MSIADLARKLGCARAEAAEFQLRCMEFALSYTHAEMPRAVAVDAMVAGEPETFLAKFFAPAVAAAMAAATGEDDPPADDEPPTAV